MQKAYAVGYFYLDQAATNIILQTQKKDIPGNVRTGCRTTSQDPQEISKNPDSGRSALVLKQSTGDPALWFPHLAQLQWCILQTRDSKSRYIQEGKDRNRNYLGAREKRLEAQVASLTKENRNLYVQLHSIPLHIIWLMLS